MDERGLRERSRRLISEFLQRHPRDKHILIATPTDTSALGALDSVRAERVRSMSLSLARIVSLSRFLR